MTHQPCKCIEEINDALGEHTLDTAIVVSRDLRGMTARTYSGLMRKDTGKAETRSRHPRVFGHKFCPFCGTPYEPQNTALSVDGPPPVPSATIEAMARLVCEWNDQDPDASLGGDGQNHLWSEAAETLVKPMLAMLGLAAMPADGAKGGAA